MLLTEQGSGPRSTLDRIACIAQMLGVPIETFENEHSEALLLNDLNALWPRLIPDDQHNVLTFAIRLVALRGNREGWSPPAP